MHQSVERQTDSEALYKPKSLSESSQFLLMLIEVIWVKVIQQTFTFCINA